MSEGGHVFGWALMEKVGDRCLRLDEHKGDLGDVEGEKFQAKRHRVI